MAKPKSDKRKSSIELDAEIQAMKKALAEKQKAAQAARRKEKAEADRAKAIEEAEFITSAIKISQTAVCEPLKFQRFWVSLF